MASGPVIERTMDSGPEAFVRRFQAPPSPAGPAQEAHQLRYPPSIALAPRLQRLRFTRRQIQFVFRARREVGEIFQMQSGAGSEPFTVTSHPDHVKSLFTAKPELVPSLTAESPLLPIVGPNSVLTANGPRHMRQRKLLLPPFHGEAIERYTEMIREVTERAIESWPLREPFALAPRMQAITLEVIMSGIFGVEGSPARGSAEYRLRAMIKRLTAVSTSLLAQIDELAGRGGAENPSPLDRLGVALLDRATYPLIAKRRRAEDLAERGDILSLLLDARTEEGELLSDQELRDELLTLVLAGFETTANSLAWTWERLVRTPAAYERLRETVRSGVEAGEQIEATILEGMRSRPVIPFIGRRVAVPWQLGEYVVPAGSAIGISILLVHHREDVYPDPFAFAPERWADRKPGTYEWIPFGGGTRRCLGAALAMAEQRVVLEAMARRLDLEAQAPEPERALHRNVTMIPARGARVVIHERRP